MRRGGVQTISEPFLGAPSGGGGRFRLHRLGNALKTAVLLAALTALLLAVGERLGGPQGLLLAGIFVVGMNVASYWFSDRIALALHRARPLSRDELPWLFDSVERLSSRAGLPMPRLYLLPIQAPNAFATGRNPSHAAVAVTRGLLERLDRRELEAVLAHELSHVKNRDTLIGTVAATLAGIISYAAQTLFFFGGTLLSRGDDERQGSAFAQLGLLLVAPIAATLLQLAVSRSREFGADAQGAALVQDPEALALALRRLEAGAEAMPYDRAPATSHLFVVNPLRGSGVMKLFSTHPSVDARVRRLAEMAGRRFPWAEGP